MRHALELILLWCSLTASSGVALHSYSPVKTANSRHDDIKTAPGIRRPLTANTLTVNLQNSTTNDEFEKTVIADEVRRGTVKEAVQGYGYMNWLTIATSIIVLSFAIVSACDHVGDEAAMIQDFDRVAKADSAAVADKSRIGHGASGHACVLDYLSFNPDGGLDNIGDIFFKQAPNARRFGFVTVIVFAVFNLTVLFVVGIGILDDYYKHLHGAGIDTLPNLRQLSNAVSDDLKHEHLIIPCAVMLYLGEFFGVAIMLALSVEQLRIFFLREHDFVRFDALRYLCWDILPTAATFSGLKALRFVHPNLLGDAFTEHWEDPHFGNSLWSRVFQVTWFVMTRLVFFILGMLAMAVRILIAASFFKRATDDVHSFIMCWAFLIQFVVQVLFILLIDSQYTERILHMFFAGSDSELLKWERRQMRIYQVRVVQEIWRSYSGFDRIVLATTFSHQEFQRLLLKEDESKKAKWMHEAKGEATPQTDSSGAIAVA